MKVHVNKKEVVTTPSITLFSLLEQLQLPTTGVAVAVNQQLVQKQAWQQCVLSEMDEIDIIHAVCGG